MREDFYGTGKSKRRLWFLVFILVFITVVCTAIIVYFFNTIPKLQIENHFKPEELTHMKGNPIQKSGTDKITLKTYSSSELNEMSTVNLLLTLDGGGTPLESVLSQLNIENIHRIYLLLCYAPLNESSRFTTLKSALQPYLKSEPKTYASGKFCLGEVCINIDHSQHIATLNKKNGGLNTFLLSVDLNYG